MARQSAVSYLVAVVAAGVLWLLQPLPQLLFVLFGDQFPIKDPSLTPFWLSTMWTVACVGFGIALIIAVGIVRKKPHRVWVAAAMVFLVYAFSAIVAAGLVGVPLREMFDSVVVIISFMLVRFHGVVAFGLAAGALFVVLRLRTTGPTEEAPL